MSRSKYINTYVRNKYDRITLQVPKGTKEEWKALAADNGLSLNEYICRLVAGNQVEIFDRMQIAYKYRSPNQSYVRILKSVMHITPFRVLLVCY